MGNLLKTLTHYMRNMLSLTLRYSLLLTLHLVGLVTAPNVPFTSSTTNQAADSLKRILKDLSVFENDLASTMLRLENRFIFLTETQLAYVRQELENAEKLINTKANLVVEDVLEAMDKHIEEFDHHEEDDHSEFIEELSDVSDILQRTDVLRDSDVAENTKMAEVLKNRVKLLQKELDLSKLLSVFYEMEPILRVMDHVRIDHESIDDNVDDLGAKLEVFWKRLRTLEALWKLIDMDDIISMFNNQLVSTKGYMHNP